MVSELIWRDDKGKEWTVTRLPTEIPEGRDEHGHLLKPRHGLSYKARIKKRLAKNPKRRVGKRFRW